MRCICVQPRVQRARVQRVGWDPAKPILGESWRARARRGARRSSQDEDRRGLRPPQERLPRRLRRGPLPVRALLSRQAPEPNDRQAGMVEDEQGPQRDPDVARRRRKGQARSGRARRGGTHLRRPWRTSGSTASAPVESSAGAEAGPSPTLSTTVPGYRRDLTYLLRPKFGDRSADGIDEREWQAFFDELAREGLSYSRLANVKAVAGSIYAWALLGRADMSRRILSSTSTSAPTSASPRTCRARRGKAADLLRTLDAEDQAPYGVAFYGGLRRGEIQRLDWVDIEMTKRSRAPGCASRPPRASPARGGDCQSPSHCARFSCVPINARAPCRPAVSAKSRSCRGRSPSARCARGAGLATRARTNGGRPAATPEADHHARVQAHVRIVPDGRRLQPA